MHQKYETRLASEQRAHSGGKDKTVVMQRTFDPYQCCVLLQQRLVLLYPCCILFELVLREKVEPGVTSIYIV